MSDHLTNPDRDDKHRRRREAGNDSSDGEDPDGREVTERLYGGLQAAQASDREGRGYYGCDLDEDGHCRRAGTEHCDWNCPHPSTPTD